MDNTPTPSKRQLPKRLGLHKRDLLTLAENAELEARKWSLTAELARLLAVLQGKGGERGR